ncbi:MAG: Uncharacterised protein [Gammaproteobacteria bacterium]|nr:MAG: Uncharacterised protein [Gammaproteobacteria bacterium]
MYYFKKMALRNRVTAIFPQWAELKENFKFVRYARKWRKKGWKAPFPCLIKRAILKATANEFGAKTFVETGTFLGDTPWFFRNEFSRIFTVEVQPDYASLAAERFSRFNHIDVIEGDSAVRLKDIVPQIEDRALYWLDGHYSSGTTGSGKNECPIWSELDTIFDCSKAPFYIMIDDARCFGEDPAYPTMDNLRSYLANKAPKFKLKVENDAIHLWNQD